MFAWTSSQNTSLTQTFLRKLLEKVLHPNKGENQGRTLDSAHGDPAQGSQRVPRPPGPQRGCCIESGQCRHCRSRGRRRVSAGKKAETQHTNLHQLEGEPPSAPSLGMDGHRTLNKGKAWRPLIPSKTKGCTKWEMCAAWLGCE